MQKIFYNASIHIFADEAQADAMLVNDDSIVFVGSKQDVFNLKSAETELVDLQGGYVFPCLFDTNVSLYKTIEENIKNTNHPEKLEKNDEIDLNYDSFSNFEAYKDEFLLLQNACLENGVTTIFEMGLSCKGFIFFKKLSEKKLLKIDVIGYVDMINYKFVMDDNCRSYRKYKNHFRLGGYTLALDGDIGKRRAWLSKPYRGEGGYKGCSNLTLEQLSFLIKVALEEKKQIVCAASGDSAVFELLECFKTRAAGKEVKELFRPIISHAGLIPKKSYAELGALGMTFGLLVSDKVENEKTIRDAIGFRQRKVHDIKRFEKFKIGYIFQGDETKLKSLQTFFEYAQKQKNAKYIKKDMKFYEKMLKNLTIYSATLGFDDNKKGTLENGKLANFIVASADFSKGEPGEILQTYLGGEKVFEKSNSK